MTRLDDLYALRNRITDEISAELARIARIQLAASQIEIPEDEEPDVIGRGNAPRKRGGRKRKDVA